MHRVSLSYEAFSPVLTSEGASLFPLNWVVAEESIEINVGVGAMAIR
jgi:hypothetical protein